MNLKQASVVTKGSLLTGMFSRPLRYYYLKIIRQNGSPEDISSGMALGVFIGLITPPGPQMVIAFIIATIFGFNRITSVLGVWISNPLTFPIIYPMQVWLGSFLFRIPIDYKMPRTVDEFYAIVTDYSSHGALLLSLLAGAVVTSIIFSLISYYITKVLVISYRENKARRLESKRLKNSALVK